MVHKASLWTKKFKAPHCKKIISTYNGFFKAWLGKGKASFLIFFPCKHINKLVVGEHKIGRKYMNVLNIQFSENIGIKIHWSFFDIHMCKFSYVFEYQEHILAFLNAYFSV